MTHRHPIGITGLAVLGAAVVLAVASWTLTAAHAQRAGDVELGKNVFETTAGGVGCAYCHGIDGRGQGTAGVDAPYIVGVQEAALRSSLAGAVPLMNFITLSEEEFQAVLAYLQLLALPPDQRSVPPVGASSDEEPSSEGPEGGAAIGADAIRTAPDAGVMGPTGILSFNVEVTDAGYAPAVISIPLGQTVQIVLRNRTFEERHFRVEGLEVDDLMWIQNVGEQPPADGAMAAHDHHDHAAHVDHAAASGAHDDHDHPLAAFVPWRVASPAGIQPTGLEVHAWAYAYSAGGGRDVVIFTPLATGTYVVRDPLHPGYTAQVIVHD